MFCVNLLVSLYMENKVKRSGAQPPVGATDREKKQFPVVSFLIDYSTLVARVFILFGATYKTQTNITEIVFVARWCSQCVLQNTDGWQKVWIVFIVWIVILSSF